MVSGGAPKEGALAADGDEKIVINYDFTDIAYTGPRPSELVAVQFDLVLANDYKVQVWSDRQTGSRVLPVLPLTGQDIEDQSPALFDILSAEGNVQDNSNQQRVVFDYGLPSSRLIYGFTVEATDIKGVDLYAEFDVSRAYSQYPNPARQAADRSLTTHARDAEAWMVNASKMVAPFYFFGEAYSMGPGLLDELVYRR